MKHIKGINKFSLITESVDVYDFGIKSGNLEEYYDVGSTLLCSFEPGVIDHIKSELVNFKVVYAAAKSEPFAWLVLKMPDGANLSAGSNRHRECSILGIPTHLRI